MKHKWYGKNTNWFEEVESKWIWVPIILFIAIEKNSKSLFTWFRKRKKKGEKEKRKIIGQNKVIASCPNGWKCQHV